MSAGMQFWLGSHMPGWLEQTAVPLFVSHRRLAGRRRLPIARGAWALDSGAFSEIAQHGRFTTSPASYAAAVDRYAAEIGRMSWAAIQDWMCEPFMTARTGLTVVEHQTRTVASYLELTTLAPHLPWVPVIQGFTAGEYLACTERYTAAGVDLRSLPLVGLGSVCRRQATTEIAALVQELAGAGLRLHGFGVKTGGLGRYGHLLASADSMAWSFTARREPALPGCTHSNCANCLRYALGWRAELACTLAGWRTPRDVTKPAPSPGRRKSVSSRVCATCGEALLGTTAGVHRPTGRPSRYCNHACRQAAYRHRTASHHPTTTREVREADAGGGGRW